MAAPPTTHRLPRAGTATDADLVAAVRQGSDAAVAAIVGRYEGQLLAAARQILGGRHHDAEECVQDAFVRAVGALRRGDREIALRAWLHAIVRNRCIDHLRRVARTVDLVDHEAALADPSPGPVSTIHVRERVAAMVDGLQGLPERQRRALVLHEFDDRSHSQIGRMLGVTPGASKALVCRARRNLAA